jgi:hypothetical protein
MFGILAFFLVDPVFDGMKKQERQKYVLSSESTS